MAEKLSNTTVEVNKNPSEEVVDSIPKATTTLKTAIQVAELKKDLESKKLNVDYLKDMFEKLPNLEENERIFILSLLILWINKKWINFSIYWDEVILNPWENTIQWNETEMVDIVSMKNIFNNYIKAWKLSLKDIWNALLFKTSWVWDYLNEKAPWQKWTIEWYVINLWQRYWLNFIWSDWKKYLIDENNIADLNKIIAWFTPEKYKEFRDSFFHTIPNISDRDYLLFYFDQKRTSNNLKHFDSQGIEKYSKYNDDARKRIISSMSILSDKEKYILWVKIPDKFNSDIQKFTNDPIKASMDLLWDEDAMTAGIFLAILWAIFWWEWNRLIWWLLWFTAWVWIEQYGWKALEMAWDFIDSDDDKKESKNVSSIYKQYSSIVKLDSWNLKVDEIDNIFKDLSKNPKFKTAPASSLDIFTAIVDPFTQRPEFLKVFWIELTKENTDYYKHIFKKLKENRQTSIWNYLNNEKVSDYLFRKSKKTESWNNWNSVLSLIEKENIPWKEIILPILRTEKYWKLQVSTIEKILLDAKWLEALFKAYGNLDFFNKHKDSIIKILEFVTSNTDDKTKILLDVLTK